MLINNFLNPVYEDFLLHFSFDGIEALFLSQFTFLIKIKHFIIIH